MATDRPTGLAARVVRALRFRATVALLGAFVLILPLAILAAGQQRQALAARASAHRAERVHADLQSLQLGVVEERAGLRDYVLTGDRRFLADYDRGRARAGAARPALAADLGNAA